MADAALEDGTAIDDAAELSYYERLEGEAAPIETLRPLADTALNDDDDEVVPAPEPAPAGGTSGDAADGNAVCGRVHRAGGRAARARRCRGDQRTIVEQRLPGVRARSSTPMRQRPSIGSGSADTKTGTRLKAFAAASK